MASWTTRCWRGRYCSISMRSTVSMKHAARCWLDTGNWCEDTHALLVGTVDGARLWPIPSAMCWDVGR